MRLQYTPKGALQSHIFPPQIVISTQVYCNLMMSGPPNGSLQSHYLSASKRSSFTQRYNFSPLVQDGS
jgi:hypothetical protein